MSFFRRRNRTGSTTNGQTGAAGSKEDAASHGSGYESASSETQDDFVDISSSDYARRRRELMELNRDLRAMGAQTILPLPCITVIGGQSAGKSSLVEAVSGINVPRDSGTCTRCPMECNLISSATTWSCQITLRLDYDNHGHKLPNSTSTPFGPMITEKANVEIWLRRAQGAILSPHRDPTELFTLNREQLRGLLGSDASVLKFSRNTVVVDIREPGATDLAFVDLPGLIQNEAQEAIDLVRNLVISSIGSETIILVTIPVSDDMENQQAVRLARDADPDGERTIGVLTKPDTLTQGAISSRKRWKDILQGRSHPLKRGYYCVRLPDDEERGRKITRSEADAVASQFFSSTPPWNEVMATDPSRFGIPNFISDISILLTAMIEKAIPTLKGLVAQLLRDNAAALEALPAPLLIDPMTELLTLVSTFCGKLKDSVYADGADKTFVHRNQALYKTFKKSIWVTAPDLRPHEYPERYYRPAIDDADLEDPEFTGYAKEMVVWGLYDVRKVIKQETGWELPHYIPFDATKYIIRQSLVLWRDPTLVCFENVFNTLSELVSMLVSSTFGRFRPLETYMHRLMSHELRECKEESMNALNRMLQLEEGPLLTQNGHYYETVRRKWLAHYRWVRYNPLRYLRSPPSPASEASHVPYAQPERAPSPYRDARDVPREKSAKDKALEALAELGYGDLSVGDLSRLHPPNQFDEELTVMADVRAYFQVAYKRIIDYVPLTIEHSLNQALSANLQSHLWQQLDLAGEGARDRITALLSEDPAIAKKRTELELKKGTLERIQRTIGGLRMQ